MGFPRPIKLFLAGMLPLLSILACGNETEAITLSPTPEVDASVDAAELIVQEPCNGLDDDGNRRVDEGCACTVGATQACYPGRQMPASCSTGTQTCELRAGTPGWGECKNALVPLPGQTECCTALGPMPQHKALQAFIAAYPIAALPSSPAAVAAFKPTAGGFNLVNGTVVVGNEFIDAGRGGVTAANVLAGRDAARAAALKNLGVADASILHSEEPPAMTMGSGCGGKGGALGSILYRTPERGVREIVYFYVGVCNGGDAEGFYHSELALEVCTAGSVPQ